MGPTHVAEFPRTIGLIVRIGTRFGWGFCPTLEPCLGRSIPAVGILGRRILNRDILDWNLVFESALIQRQ